MDTHVKVLGVLQIAMGAMCLFGAVVLMLVGLTCAKLLRHRMPT